MTYAQEKSEAGKRGTDPPATTSGNHSRYRTPGQWEDAHASPQTAKAESVPIIMLKQTRHQESPRATTGQNTRPVSQGTLSANAGPWGILRGGYRGSNRSRGQTVQARRWRLRLLATVGTDMTTRRLQLSARGTRQRTLRGACATGKHGPAIAKAESRGSVSGW
jgi:hypothetical protein